MVEDGGRKEGGEGEGYLGSCHRRTGEGARVWFDGGVGHERDDGRSGGRGRVRAKLR